VWGGGGEVFVEEAKDVQRREKVFASQVGAGRKREGVVSFDETTKRPRW